MYVNKCETAGFYGDCIYSNLFSTESQLKWGILVVTSTFEKGKDERAKRLLGYCWVIHDPFLSDLSGRSWRLKPTSRLSQDCP